MRPIDLRAKQSLSDTFFWVYPFLLVHFLTIPISKGHGELLDIIIRVVRLHPTALLGYLFLIFLEGQVHLLLLDRAVPWLRRNFRFINFDCLMDINRIALRALGFCR